MLLPPLSPIPSFSRCRNLCRVVGQVHVNKWKIIWHRGRICGIHKQRRFHRLWVWRRILGWTGILWSARPRRRETWQLYVVDFVSIHVFVSSYCIHFLASWDEGPWPVFSLSLISIIMVVQYVIVISWCKLQEKLMKSTSIKQVPLVSSNP